MRVTVTCACKVEIAAAVATIRRRVPCVVWPQLGQGVPCGTDVLSARQLLLLQNTKVVRWAGTVAGLMFPVCGPMANNA